MGNSLWFWFSDFLSKEKREVATVFLIVPQMFWMIRPAALVVKACYREGGRRN
jgi:hypothetical protein